jgi:folate-binding protein YgfZ
MQCNLTKRALIKISGTDAEEFLQNQFTNDIKKLDNSHLQINAYCQHQGKIITLFWVMHSRDGFLLSFPVDLVEKVISRLQMFVIMSDVLIEDVSEEFSQIGLVNEHVPGSYFINEKMSLLITSSKNQKEKNTSNSDEWIKASIDCQLPEVFLSTSEKFVPQMLNLDMDEVGVNFSKGCYPGQEVVARLHYLGEAKRRLFAFQSDSKVQIGDNLYCASSKAAKARGDRYKGSGLVVNTVKYNSKFYCLATLDVDLKDEKITINNESGQILTRINNE